MFDSLIKNPESNADKVTLPEYLKWQKHFSFEALRGKKYGESFCEHFNITDFRIKFERNWNNCDKIIRSDWLVRA